MKKIDIFYFSGTHWDREWYQDFQGFRYRLVDMVNYLLDLLERDKDYKTFHFDGQTIVLDDFLEICPERREELASRIREGKILIGPWYVMPDEFLVSGESLIRNLMIGHKISSSYGVEPWKFGYVCDCFGHTAQFLLVTLSVVSAIDSHARYIHEIGETLELAVNLLCKFSCRSHYHTVDGILGVSATAQPVEHGQQICCGLSSTCLCNANEVASLHQRL